MTGSRPRLGLVLGAGGTVGLAYHAGVLRALERAGVDLAGADLVVGTSAGSVMGAQVRSGRTGEDLWQLALGEHPTQESGWRGELEQRRKALYTPGWASPLELWRRSIGSSWVLARSTWRFPLPEVPAVLGRWYPGGLFTFAEGRRQFGEQFPAEWPERPLWLNAVDLGSGRRVVLGRPGGPRCTLHQAVAASCAVPGMYDPVRVGRLTLVDGGAHSTSNLDLAGKFGCELIIGVVPMAYEPRRRPDPIHLASRQVANRALAREVASAKRRGAEVLLIRPGAAELAAMGRNAMRPTSTRRATRAAYEQASQLLESGYAKELLGPVAA